MSKSKVNEYFSTRKRGRFNQNDVLLNKQLKTQSVIDPTDEVEIAKSKLVKAVETELQTRRSTRSSSRLNKKDEQNEKAVAELKIETPAPAPTSRAERALARRQKLEELKAKMNRLDDKLEKVKEVAPKPVETKKADPVVQEQPAPTKQKGGRKKVNKAELMAKIQSFNDNLIATQEKIAKAEEVAKPVEPTMTEETSAAAAFNKFKDLASADIDIKCTLTLPSSYARILDSFKGSDSIVKFLTNRQEVCTFLKLKLGIQNITKHTFTQKHLGQIQTVYPTAYYFKQEKMFIDFKNDYHLTIRPNLDEIEEIDSVKGIKDFSPSVLLTRLNKFKSNLFMLVKNFHQKFLESLGITNVDFKDIKRWHPKFDLESVEEIIEGELPKRPNDSIKCKTGQDLLNIAKDVYSSRIQEAIKEHTKEAKVDSVEIIATDPKLNESPAAVQATVTKENTKPLSADEQKIAQLKEKKEKSYNSLLEKIRNKQKTKELESMVVNSDKEKKIVKYGLFKDTIRFLLFFFQAEKKATLDMEKVHAKLADNLKEKITESESRDLLNEMCNEPNLHGENDSKWISVIKVRNVNYIKMDKSFQMTDLWAKVDKMVAAL